MGLVLYRPIYRTPWLHGHTASSAMPCPSHIPLLWLLLAVVLVVSAAAPAPAPPHVPVCGVLPPPPPQQQPQPPSTPSTPGGDNFVPATLSNAPHYYTTWASQGYMPGDCWTAKNLTIDWIFSHQGGAQQAALNSAYLFGKPGLAGSAWVPTFFPQSRGELFFMLDQGYATGDQKIEPSLTHFPQWANLSDPGARLLKFNRAVQAHGWRGLGLWNRIQGDDAGQAYARQAANWSRFANISYWKIDGPDGDCKASDAAKEVFPELIIEHGFVRAALLLCTGVIAPRHQSVAVSHGSWLESQLRLTHIW
jgi:hypothetical protein